jgi:hypothetical protein
MTQRNKEIDIHVLNGERLHAEVYCDDDSFDGEDR